MSSEKKRALQKLAEVNMGAGGCRLVTPFRSLALLVTSEVAKGDRLGHYLEAMARAAPTPDLLLKQAVLVHILIQEKSQLDQEQLLGFLGRLLETSGKLLEKHTKQELREGGSASCGRSVSTRSEDLPICKEVLLLSTVVRPYLGYLMKIASTASSFRRFERRTLSFERHEAWGMLNLLRTIGSISSQFTLLGRYYMRSYGHLVVLLSKALSRDISNLVEASSKYVGAQNHLLSCLNVVQEGREEELRELVQMLQEISLLNEQLLPLYFGKYFFESMREVPEPRWVNTSSEEYDTLFKVHQVLLKSTREAPSRRDRNRILATE
jgi:hypothetical protein